MNKLYRKFLSDKFYEKALTEIKEGDIFTNWFDILKILETEMTVTEVVKEMIGCCLEYEEKNNLIIIKHIIDKQKHNKIRWKLYNKYYKTSSDSYYKKNPEMYEEVKKKLKKIKEEVKEEAKEVKEKDFTVKGVKGKIASINKSLIYTAISPKDQKYLKDRGVYKFQLDNKVYIGSTGRDFLSRFKQHFDSNSDAIQLIIQGGTIEFLYIARFKEDRISLYKKEQYYYDVYKFKGYELINQTNPYIKDLPKEPIPYDELKRRYEKLVEANMSTLYLKLKINKADEELAKDILIANGFKETENLNKCRCFELIE